MFKWLKLLWTSNVSFLMALRTTQLEFIVVIWPSHYQQQDLRLFSELNSHQIGFAHTTYTCVSKPGCRESLLASPQSLGPVRRRTACRLREDYNTLHLASQQVWSHIGEDKCQIWKTSRQCRNNLKTCIWSCWAKRISWCEVLKLNENKTNNMNKQVLRSDWSAGKGIFFFLYLFTETVPSTFC